MENAVVGTASLSCPSDANTPASQPPPPIILPSPPPTSISPPPPPTSGSCQVSDWSEWSECSMCANGFTSCTSCAEGTMTRTRQIVSGSTACPALEETMPCITSAAQNLDFTETVTYYPSYEQSKKLLIEPAIAATGSSLTLEGVQVMLKWSRQVFKNGQWEVHAPETFKVDCWRSHYQFVVPNGMKATACDYATAEMTPEGLLITYKNIWLNDGQQFVGPPSKQYPGVIFTVESKEWLVLDKSMTSSEPYCVGENMPTGSPTSDGDSDDDACASWSAWSSCRSASSMGARHATMPHTDSVTVAVHARISGQAAKHAVREHSRERDKLSQALTVP
eukprot:scaffold4720_cov382-Prasinococcus_capsulatus_cf.AAC.6